MAVVWDPQKGDIPEDQLGYNVSEETTDGNLSALYYTPTYYDPVADETRTGAEIKVTDSALLSKYKESQDAEVAKPTLSMSGTWYEAKGSAPSEPRQKAAFYEEQARKMMQACSRLTGRKYDSCIQAVNARISQMAQKALPQYATGGLVKTKEPTMMNRTMYPQGYADGGMPMMPAEEAMPGLMEPSMPPMEDEAPMESMAVDKIMAVLDETEMQVLNEALDMHPELVTILDKAYYAIQDEFTGEGPVSGPGTETSDSIPARLSDGEFVFTAKAVKQLGVDKLRKMMDKAESEYDSSMMKQEKMQTEAGGFNIGGLLDKVTERNQPQATSMQSATANFQMPQERTVPMNVNGAGNQMPAGQQGIMASKTVDLQNQYARSLPPKNEMNTNQQSQTPAGLAAAAGNMPRASVETEQGRADMQQRLATSTQEDQQPSLMMP
jgi:hypothetical protein